MKAAMLNGPRDIRIEEVPDPVVEPDGVIVRVRNCGVCGSDLHPYKLSKERAIPGHECSGDIVAVGGNVKHLHEGDRVAAIGIRPCGECHWCQVGEADKCRRQIWPPHQRMPGGFAEYLSVPNVRVGFDTVVKLPDSLTYEQGATIEPLSIALYAVTRAQLKPEDTVVIIGAGTIGLLVLQVVKALGAGKVIVSGRRSKRLQLARDGGADVVIDAATEDLVPAVREATNGADADVVFECAGVPVTLEQSIRVVHNHGRVVLLGIFEETVDWNPNISIGRNVSLLGCLGEDFPGTVRLLESGRADTRPLITHRFPLEQTKDAFEAALTADDAVKVMVDIP
jgi:L-iditol 2-dehydrogenase